MFVHVKLIVCVVFFLGGDNIYIYIYIYMHGKASQILELVMCSTKNHVETSEIVSKQEG